MCFQWEELNLMKMDLFEKKASTLAHFVDKIIGFI